MKLSYKVSLIALFFSLFLGSITAIVNATVIGPTGGTTYTFNAPLSVSASNVVSLSTNSNYFRVDANNALTLTSSFVSSVGLICAKPQRCKLLSILQAFGTP